MKRFIPLLLISAVLLCSCGLPLRHIADTNGEEDSSLCTLTEEALCAEHTTRLTYKTVRLRSGNKQSYKAGKFSGVETLFTFTYDADHPLTLTLQTERTEGNLRLFWWHDGEIVKDIPTNAFYSEIESFPENGRYELRAAGESAAFSVEMTESDDTPRGVSL